MSSKVTKPRPQIKKPTVSKSAKKRVEIQSGDNSVSPVNFINKQGE